MPKGGGNNHQLVVLVKGATTPTLIVDLDANPVPKGKMFKADCDADVTYVNYSFTTFEDEMGTSKTGDKPVVHTVYVFGPGSFTAQAQGNTILVHAFGDAIRGSHTLRLLNMAGQQVVSTSFTGTNASLSAPASGAYLVQIDAQTAQKIVVQ